MAYQFILPDIGEGVVEAEVQQWFVKVGDKVVEDQPLVEVMTDKATVTIPSPKRGTITKLCWKAGDIAKVHAPLVEMELEGGAATAEAPKTPAPKAHSSVASVAAPHALHAVSGGGGGQGLRQAQGEQAVRGPGGKALAAPAVRALARQMGVDINSVSGSGPGGRVTKDDLRGGSNGAAARAIHEAPRATPKPTPIRPAPAAVGADVETIPFRGLRRKIAERMTISKQSAAHFTFVEQVDVTDLKTTKEAVAASVAEQGVKMTYLPFIVKAVVAALKKHPTLNASLDEEKGEIQLKRRYHIGIASATEQGLVVPVVRDADQKSLLDLARDIQRLSEDTKAGKGKPEDMGGSTFTITSLGAQGGLFATPIINHPEVAILGVHKIKPTPVVHEGQIVARDVMYISLSFDHRVIDGHVGAAFTYTLMEYLQTPTLLFVESV
jgi:pyruvate dehydrogenase E2 component (dihydrolipoamide acetyltransferase)